MPRQYGIGRRAPALRTLATSYDFKETWFIDVSSCIKILKITTLKKVYLQVTVSSYDFKSIFLWEEEELGRPPGINKSMKKKNKGINNT